MAEVFESPKWKSGNYYTCRGGCRDLVERDGKTYIMAHFQDFYSGDSFADELAAGKWQQITQEHLNAEAGWLPIDSREPEDWHLVTTDPTEPGCVHGAWRMPDGQHSNGFCILEKNSVMPTHWMPVPVPAAAKVGG